MAEEEKDDEEARKRRLSAFYQMKQAEIDSAAAPALALPEILRRLEDHEARIKRIEAALIGSEEKKRAKGKSRST